MASIPLKSDDSLPPRRGIIFILSAPSGAGKTTIYRAALKAIAESGIFDIPDDARAAREGEADGIDYSFVSEEEFKRRQSSGELAEWARVFESSYGTPRAPLDAAIASGRDILLDIDIQGARQIRAKYPARCGFDFRIAADASRNSPSVCAAALPRMSRRFSIGCKRRARKPRPIPNTTT